MRWFRERDVRRQYDLLQHTEERGVTALLASDRDQVIGLGLFDNEDDFVSECARYNRNGMLYVGVNPRRTSLLDDYGGLRNRVRTLISDVCVTDDVNFVTGLAVPSSTVLSDEMTAFANDASVLNDGHTFFALDEALKVEEDAESLEHRVKQRITGFPTGWSYRLLQYIPVVGTARAEPGLFKRRFRFRRFRPYFIDGLCGHLGGTTG